MSTQRQLRRGTNAESEVFTGAVGETVYDSTKKRLVNHDGSTVGGIPVPNFVDIQNGLFTCADGVGTDTITLALEKAPTAYAEYQSFTFKPASNNTGAVTININSLGAKDIKKDDGSGSLVALDADDLKANIPVNIIYDGTRFIAQLGGDGSPIDIQEFTGSGTWSKPSKGSIAIVEIWGGGGGGAKTDGGAYTCGGAGGGFVCRKFNIADMASSETVVIGAGGNGSSIGGVGGNSTAGGQSTFGTSGNSNYCNATGGGQGLHTNSSCPSGGSGSNDLTFNFAAGPEIVGGGAGAVYSGGWTNGKSSVYGGAGCGAYNSVGPASVFGGGAGSGANYTTSGGGSIYGGKGGKGGDASTAATNGSVPGGGGGGAWTLGNGGGGGAGFCRVTCY